MQTDALTPAQALAYLRELNPSLGAVAIAGEQEAILAGAPPPAGVPGTIEVVDGPVAVRATAPPAPLDVLARHDAVIAAAAVRARC